VCVKDEWKCLLLLYIIISLLCLSKCKTNVVTKLIFENSCHTLVRWWCKGIYKILTIGKKKLKKFLNSIKLFLLFSTEISSTEYRDVLIPKSPPYPTLVRLVKELILMLLIKIN
jgi:hypothetical protein